MNDMKRLLSYAGPYKRDMIFGAVLVLVETCFELFIPILISNLIDIGVANGDIPYIYRKGIQMGVCALCALVTGILYAHFAARATYGWGAEIRKAEYEKMQQYAFSNLDHFAVSSLITRMTTDVTVIQNMVSAGFRPMGELSSYAAEICESLYKSTGGTVAVCDRDSMIAVSGGGKKELLEKPVSKALEEIMENRRAVRTDSGSRAPRPVESAEDYAIAVAAPILAEGDVLGCVMFLSHPGSPAATDLEFKLAQTVAGFLGRQMEG